MRQMRLIKLCDGYAACCATTFAAKDPAARLCNSSRSARWRPFRGHPILARSEDPQVHLDILKGINDTLAQPREPFQRLRPAGKHVAAGREEQQPGSFVVDLSFGFQRFFGNHTQAKAEFLCKLPADFLLRYRSFGNRLLRCSVARLFDYLSLRLSSTRFFEKTDLPYWAVRGLVLFRRSCVLPPAGCLSEAR